MKKIFYKIFPILSVACMMTLTGCLTDTEYENGINGIKPGNNNFVEVHLTSSDTTNTGSRAYDQFNRDTTIVKFIPINLTSGPATSDVTVSFQLLDATNPIMASYIADGNAIPDPTKFVVQNTGNKVVIPAGSSTAYIQVKFNPSSLGGFYIFGIKITAVSDPKYTISNLATGFIKFGIKNIYDGDYTMNGTLVDAANGGITGQYPAEVFLETVDGTSVVMFEPTIYGNFYHLISSGGSVSVYGSFAPVFKFDANNNVISVTNHYGQPAANGRSAEIDPSGINKYDPATHKLSVSYWMNQPSVIAGHRTHFVEVFTYLGKR